MVTIVGVRFKKAGKIYYFLPDTFSLAAGDGVIVETARGLEFGTVVIGPKDVKEDTLATPLKSVVRKATEKVRKTKSAKKRLSIFVWKKSKSVNYR